MSSDQLLQWNERKAQTLACQVRRRKPSVLVGKRMVRSPAGARCVSFSGQKRKTFVGQQNRKPSRFAHRSKGRCIPERLSKWVRASNFFACHVQQVKFRLLRFPFATRSRCRRRPTKQFAIGQRHQTHRGMPLKNVSVAQ